MRSKLSRIKYSDAFWAFLLLLPNLLGFLVFTVFPVIASFVLSITEWDLLTPMKFAGAQNYVNLAHDQTFWKVLWNTVYFTVGTVPVGIALSLLLAVALTQKLRGVQLFRAMYVLPGISSTVAVAIVWQWMYNPEFGLLNYILSLFGIQGPLWLTSTRWAMPAVIITSIWKGLGFNMLLFLAVLQVIEPQFYEAARIDGASAFAQFRHITVPLLAPTTFFVTVMSIISSFQVFDQVHVMTAGGPARSTSVLVHYLYQNAFQYFKMGYASAIAYVLFIIVFIATMLQFRGRKATYWSLY